MLVLKRRFIEGIILSKNDVLNDIVKKNIIYEKDMIKANKINDQLSFLHSELVLINKIIKNFD